MRKGLFLILMLGALLALALPSFGQGTTINPRFLPTVQSAGTGHAKGAVPDPGATVHTPPYLLGDDSLFHQLAAGTGLSLTFSSGTFTLSLAAPTATTLGGIESITSTTHEWIDSISTAGVPHQSQPAFTDISGNISTGQMNSGTGASSATFWRGDGTWGTPSGSGGSLPTDYISGCNLLYDTTTAIQVTTGTAYNPIDSAADTISSTITDSPTLAASTLYYVYLNSGGASVTVSTSAPATNYQGTAWEDGSGRRYLGSFLTDGSSHIYNFVMTGGGSSVVQYEANLFAAPFEVLNAGTATSATNVSCSTVVPPMATYAAVILKGSGILGQQQGIGNANIVPTSSTGLFTWAMLTNTTAEYSQIQVPLVSQAFTYINQSSSDSLSAFVSAYGFSR